MRARHPLGTLERSARTRHSHERVGGLPQRHWSLPLDGSQGLGGCAEELGELLTHELEAGRGEGIAKSKRWSHQLGSVRLL